MASDPKQPIKKPVAAEDSNFPIELDNEKHVGPKYCDGLLTRKKALAFNVQRPELLLCEDEGKNLSEGEDQAPGNE